MTDVGEFFGTLQESITEEWRHHLKTHKYSAHMALDEYYKEMPEQTDILIEAYQGAHSDIVINYKSIVHPSNDPITYLKAVRDVTREGRKQFCDTTELQSDCDNILSLQDSTIYKLEQLTEGKIDLRSYLEESLQNE